MTAAFDFNTAMLLLASATIMVTFLRNGAYWYRMWRQPARIHDERAAVRRGEGDRGSLIIHYVIPAFQEVEAIPLTLASLKRAIEESEYRTTVTIVTSVHDEPQFEGERTTRIVAEELCADLPNARVIVDHTPAPSMAAAFNTGMRTIAEQSSGSATRSFVAVYNADSSANIDSTQALGDTILAWDYPPVLQVNHSSLRNLDSMTGVGGWYSQGAAYYQTRWALGFEFDLHRRNSSPTRKGPLGHSYHLKGHGLVMRLDTAMAMGGLSTDTPCEDLELGFRLSLKDVPVVSVPVLEDTESPLTPAAVIAQKGYWFSGMLDVVNFHSLQPEQKHVQPWRFELQRAASIYRSAACFLLAPVPYWLLVAIAGILGQPLLALPPVLNAFMSVWLIRRALRKFGSDHRRLRSWEIVSVPMSVLLWSMTRNVGPIAYLCSIARHPGRVERLRAVHLQHIEESSVRTGGPNISAPGGA
ncbi:glycosyltransferase [Microbacterium sp. Leaf320]|uniref:glycosyltransferase n=1 Tax=Microbacterium sp. Leaf320 TaxID=1736334 RepID=UPI0006FB8F79|nr:glycosyltransferase family 2 protein [Microbacterium sp. Leaf320]KQQ69195.1 hypothetical protein ASF63_04390 [Microbacterium sp. Leaf320]